jgi:UDP-glucose 4-epimerase
LFSSVLISGGCGFIGSNLVFKLLASGVKVKIFDNLSRPAKSNFDLPDLEIIQGDIRDISALKHSVEGVDAVVHLAAFGSVIESIEDPIENFEINARGTLNVLRASQQACVSRVIFASTGGALIGDTTPPVDENSLPKPISPYGASKLCGEAYCHALAKSYGLETVCLRFGNVYGPHSAHKKGAVTTFIKALMRDEPIVIYGDGSASRDYVHVADLCSGISVALDAPLQGGEVFHLASGRETTVLELATILRDVAGKPDHPIEFKSARTGEVVRNFATYDKARETFGFNPELRLEDGLAMTWDWFVSQGDAVLAIEATDS